MISAEERMGAMKRALLVMSLLGVVFIAGLLPGCSNNSGSSTPPDGSGGVITTGKAQALVFTTPT
jgi:hypothetical protein